jgi:hypothetical protein
MADINDLQLIQAIKQENNSEALSILVNKHTGVYLNVINKYTYVPHFERQEMIDHKLLNIYNYALAYDPSRGMQFSTFVGQSVKWECQGLVNKYPEPEEIKFDVLEEIDRLKPLEERDSRSFIEKYADSLDDERLTVLIGMRLKSKPDSWKKCGKAIGTSPEGARWIYNKFYNQIKEKLTNE